MRLSSFHEGLLLLPLVPCALALGSGPACAADPTVETTPKKLDPGQVWCATISPNGKTVAAVSGHVKSPGQVMVWDIPTRKLLWRRAEKEGARSVVFSPDGKFLAIALYEGAVQLLDAKTGAQRMMLRRSKAGINGIAFSSDGQTLAAAGLDGFVTVWDLTTRKTRFTFHGHPHTALAVALSADSKTLASVGGDTGKGGTPGEAIVRDLTTGTERATLKGHTSVVESVAISPNGKTVATGSWDWSVRLWDAHTGKLLRKLPTNAGGGMSVQFSPDGKVLAAVACNLPNGAGTILLWDPDTGKLIRRIHFSRAMACVGFSPDGKTLVTGCWDGTVRLWEVQTGDQRLAFTGYTTPKTETASDSRPSRQSATQWCAKLGSRNAQEAYRAIWALAALGDQAVPALDERLKHPVKETTAKLDPGQVAKMIAELDDDRTATREAASDALGQLGKAVTPFLRQALNTTNSAEVELRLRILLDQITASAARSPLLIRLRAIEALEHIGTARARLALADLDKPAMEKRVRDEARAALERLRQKPRARITTAT
jgi:Tol biopolymer transport system component